MPRLGSGSQTQTQTQQSILSSPGGLAESQQLIGGRSLTSAANMSIAKDRDPIARKLPLKTSSFNMRRPLASHDSAPILPDRSPDSIPSKPRVQPKRATSVYRAAEKGKTDVLPTAARPRTQSANSFKQVLNSVGSAMNRTSSIEAIQPRNTVSLRSRRRGGSGVSRSDDEATILPISERYPEHNGGHYNHRDARHDRHSWSDDTDAGYQKSHHNHTHGRKKDRFNVFPMEKSMNIVNMKPLQFTIVMLLLAVACFVAGSYRRVLGTTELLKEVKHEESLLLLHLQRVEQQSLQLHDNLSRLADRSSDGGNAARNGAQSHGRQSQGAVQVDSNLIRMQTEKLREMEAELDHEVNALQKRIQASSRRSIVENYGEGAVEIVLDLSLEGDASADAMGEPINRLAIRLWYDTPHSVWTFLQQVRNGVWNGAPLELDQGRGLIAQSKQNNPQPGLHFVEHSEKGHERYTVGLTESSILINLQDNREYYKHEACVGSIIEGFDVLHRIISKAQGSDRKSIVIKRATASHLTRADGAPRI